MPASSDMPIERLNRIVALMNDALALADEGEEFMLGAKLSDSLRCAQERIEALSARQ